MKKIFFTILVFAFCIGLQGQKITALTEATTAPTGSLLIVRSGTTGDVLKRITEANLFSPLLKVKDSTAYVNSYMSRFDAVTGLALKLTITDTTNMLTRYPTFSESRDVVADSLNKLRNNAIQLKDLAVMLLPDTVAVTSSRALALTDAGKRLRVTGTHITLPLPPSTDVAFPKETTIYVKLMSASTVLHFANGAGVDTYSVGDSTNGNTQYKWYGIIYWDHDNYELIGVED
jgi:hypothetical protein